MSMIYEQKASAQSDVFSSATMIFHYGGDTTNSCVELYDAYYRKDCLYVVSGEWDIAVFGWCSE